MIDLRLPRQAGEVIDRSDAMAFTWNGAAFSGLRGDTIASALAASGVRVFSRSLKYHRRRGILTADYLDPNTMVQVGDEPNVRAGHRKLEAGMEVSSQNTWPSLERDAKAANSLVGRFLSPGFYYKTFISPRPAWPLYQRVLRRFAHGGRVDRVKRAAIYDKRHAHPDVVVAGGGPAGMAAALAAAEEGADVMLVDEQHDLGGHLRWGDAADLETLADLRTAVLDHPAIEVLTDSVVGGRYDHNWVLIHQRSHSFADERLIKARAKALVVAAGTIERPYVFEGNDLPGVMLGGAARRLINLYAVKPGERAVVFGGNPALEAVVDDLERVGVEVAAVSDAREGGSLIRATGRGAVRSVELGSGRVEADLLVTATGWTTPTSLLNMAGCRPVYHEEAARFLPGDLPDDVLATGGMIGDGSTAELVGHGRATGRHAAARALALRHRWLSLTPGARVGAEPTVATETEPELVPAHHPQLYRAATHGFVDFSEDVTSKDLHGAVAEGFDSMELDKRFTTVTMGPIQGKLEVGNAVAIHAEATGRSIEHTGTTTWRPPYAPVTLGALAGAHMEPVRHSPMQSWHEANGAVPIVAGQWIRPEHYGNPHAEVRNVRSNVGLIDVSPLGKIELRGSDVWRLLDFLYTNRWESLAVGSVRYGVMCAEDGVVMDDGVVGRLEANRYLMTTTSGGAGRVWNWIDDWLQTGHPDWDVTVTAVTDGYASINVAGPRSRQLLARITDLDLAADAFGYMRVRTGTVADVADCVVWRIGFTGELSYEVHVPAGYAMHLWEALLEAGADLGIGPFGLEAQRIMRLEKGHFIVGQDTDGLTKAFTAGVDWAIKLDKDDFVGKPELVWQSGEEHEMLVGLQTIDPLVVPDEACQIVEDGRIRGRITSSRMSPTLERSICLAIVDRRLATPGSRVQVTLVSGELAPAVVMPHHAHFDPAGERLRG